MSLDKAKALAANGRIAEAETLFDALVRAKPKNAVVLSTYVRFHNRYSRKFRKAAAAVESLVALKPKSAEVQALAAETYSNCNRLAEAEQHAAAALHIDPANPDSLFIAAHVDAARNRPDAAIAKIELALTKRPDHMPSLIQKGRYLRAAGDLAKAAAVARDLWETHPDNIDVISLLFSVGPVAADDPVLAHLKLQILPPLAKTSGVAFADALKLLAKAHLDAGNHNAAYDAFSRAKSAAPMRRDEKGYASFIQTLCTSVTRADYATPTGDPSDQPVLIIGFPRSGSTLLEQMLTGHSQISSVGESPALPNLCQQTGMRSHYGGDMVSAIRQIPLDATHSFGKRYLAEIACEKYQPRVIDKALHNFELLGLFAKILPNARIIDMRRDPLDTCVSCYLQPLSAWHSYTQDIGLLGRTYAQYRKLMTHWGQVLPNPILTLRYEDVIADQETALRKTLAFLDLPWDPAVLDHANSKNHSHTLSTAQVRAPLSSKAMGRWKHYEPHLDPLKAALQDFYPDGWDGAYL